jgi:hypothetical protein
MGYTHYWSFKAPKRGEAAKVEKNYQRAIKQCNKIIKAYSAEYGGLSGYSAHAKGYGGLHVNGSRENACEDFILREHFSQNLEIGFRPGCDFCKTAQNPYDVVVVACLIVLKHYLPDNIQVNSDGNKSDWIDGLNLATKVLKLKSLKIPVSIRGNALKLVGYIFEAV